jgi:hypothetical protein
VVAKVRSDAVKRPANDGAHDERVRGAHPGLTLGRATMTQPDNEPAEPAATTPGGHLARALEAAVAALRARVEAAERRADAAEADRRVAETRADDAVVKRDEANCRAEALKAVAMQRLVAKSACRARGLRMS